MLQVKRRDDETEIGSFEREGLTVSLTVVAAWSNEDWVGIKLYDSGGRKRVYYLTLAKDCSRWRQSKDLAVLESNFPKAKAWIEKQVRDHNGKTSN
jgi:hypothetical protein